MAPKNLLALALFIVCLCMPPQAAKAQEATLANIVVTNTRDDLLLYLSIEGCFTPDMEQAIMNGAATTFQIYVSLYRIRDLWWDSEIADITVKHTIQYDAMKKEFSVTRTENPDNVLTTHSFPEAKKAMAEVDSLVVCPLSELQRGSTYQIKAKAELDKVELPLYLHYVLFFVSLWDFETDWYTINFHY